MSDPVDHFEVTAWLSMAIFNPNFELLYYIVPYIIL